MVFSVCVVNKNVDNVISGLCMQCDWPLIISHEVVTQWFVQVVYAV